MLIIGRIIYGWAIFQSVVKFDVLLFAHSTPESYAIDYSKATRILGWNPKVDFEEGIEKTVKWYLDNKEWMKNVTSGDYKEYYKKMYE